MCEASTKLVTIPLPQGKGSRYTIEPVINIRPAMVLEKYGHVSAPAKDDGLWENDCWPSAIAKTDPGFALLAIDDWYDKNPNAKKWDYKEPYDPPTNGDKA
ncbi:hypothetical protein FSOLCH5_014701 [Fusarium solani]